MFKEEGGFHYFTESELEGAKKNGWVDGEPVRKKLMDAKLPPESRQTSAIIPPIAKVEEVATIPTVTQPHPQDTKRRPGRPPNKK